MKRSKKAWKGIKKYNKIYEQGNHKGKIITAL
jgi:hypothetical protein